MEPIRPDDEELRAEAPLGSANYKKPASRKTKAPEPSQKAPPKQSKPDKGAGGGKSRGGLSLLWLLLIGFGCAAAAGWYAQGQRIQALEGQLEEADYWARQSKLALARFEGDLSETGENLQERGASLSEQAAENKKQLKAANSEIGKLWVVANERNKGRLNEHQERLTAVEKGLVGDSQALATLTASVEKMQTSFTTDLTAMQKQIQTSISALEDANRQAADQLTALSKKVANVDQIVDGRIRRFEQEQKLGISGMDSRIAALEKASGDSSQLQTLKNELNSLKRTVESIDSSRAQLTSRLVRLSEEVNKLRAGQ